MDRPLIVPTDLSAAFHDAWIEAPAQRVCIDEVDFSGRIAALIVLDNGRTPRIEPTGRAGNTDLPAGHGGAPLPTIAIDVDDPILAATRLEEVGKHLTLLDRAGEPKLMLRKPPGCVSSRLFEREVTWISD